MGSQLVEPNNSNPRGFFEDVEFLSLNRRLLFQGTPDVAEGHRDWGWIPSEQFDRSRLHEYRDEAYALITKKQGQCWGWKDPRTTINLDFWHEALLACGCDPVYVLVYRFPWDVADSMQRLGAPVFLKNPEYAVPIWCFYNRLLLSFYRKHRSRCVLMSSNAGWENPEQANCLIRKRLGIDSSARLETVMDTDLWRARTGPDPIVALMNWAWPNAMGLLREMDDCADLPSSGLWSLPSSLRFRDRSGHEAVDLSVIVPCHDDGEFLIESVASVERHAPDSTELVIVNDGSSQPRTIAVLDALRGAGYRIIDQPHSGLSAARNHGISLSRGRFVLPLDVDNRICEGFADMAVQVLEEQPEVGVVYGDRYDFGMRRGRMHVPEFDLDMLLWENYIDACAIFRRSLWAECDKYDPALGALEDWELWISAAERGWQFYHLNAITFEYRVRPESLLSTTQVSGPQLHAHILEKHAALYVPRITELLRGPMREQGVAPSPPLNRLITGLGIFLHSREAERVQCAAAAAEAAADLREMRAELDRAVARHSSVEAELRSCQSHLTNLETCAAQQEAALASIQNSATWRWSRLVLESKTVSWLMGPLIRLVAARSQRARSNPTP
jgi:hypothetical protein